MLINANMCIILSYVHTIDYSLPVKYKYIDCLRIYKPYMVHTNKYRAIAARFL